MKKRYTAVMLVAAMLMMSPKLPIRASHAHAEGEEEQTNEANSSEQPGAQTKVIWKKNGARGEVLDEDETADRPVADEGGETTDALPPTPAVVWPEPGEATPGEISREGDEDEIALPILEDEERPVADGEGTYSSLSMTRQSTWRPWRKRWGKTTSA